MNQRYFYKRSRANAEYIIKDKELDQPIAVCRYLEQARLVCRALNRVDTADKNDKTMTQDLFGGNNGR